MNGYPPKEILWMNIIEADGIVEVGDNEIIVLLSRI